MVSNYSGVLCVFFVFFIKFSDLISAVNGSDPISKLHALIDRHRDAFDRVENDPKLKKLFDVFFTFVANQDQKHEKEVARLRQRIEDLENRFLKDSHNSSKPPSSDGLKKVDRTQSLRTKSKRKPGGQPGHKGVTLGWTEKPDEITLHEKRICPHCGTPLRLGRDRGYEARQVVDIQQGKRHITEHRALIKCCSRCNQDTKGEFPEWLKSKVQYGGEVKALGLYFVVYQLIPYARTSEIFFDLWGIRISPGTLVSIVSRSEKKLKNWEIEAKKKLIQEKVLGFDETGVRCEKNLNWLHVVRSETTTLYVVHKNRGTPAFEEIGILPEFKGTAIHDGLKSYFEYTGCKHGLCNAHHLRELKYIQETTSYQWPKEIADFLCATKSLVESRQTLNHTFKKKVNSQYSRLLKRAYREMGSPLEWREKKWIEGSRKKHQKQTKRTPERLLLNRLRDYRKSVLAFTRSKEIPFTNNGSEQDIRMAKLKQKISGSFRSRTGAVSFYRLRSYISTHQKNNLTPFSALKSAA